MLERVSSHNTIVNINNIRDKRSDQDDTLTKYLNVLNELGLGF